MSTGDWDVGRSASGCTRCGRAFREGDEHYSVLLDAGTSFARQDVCPECWPQQPQSATLGHWKTRVPKKDAKKRRFVDDDVIVNFFERCDGAEDPLKLNFRFVLALVLMRKRLLKYEDSAVENGREVWRMKVVGRGETTKVVNPKLNEEEIAQVSEELGKILNAEV